jgi:dTDP-D-glucose 4,6-dehydratase
VVNVLAGRAAADRKIVVQGGGQWRPFVHVADAASVLAVTLTMPLEQVSGEIFNLGSNLQNHTIAGVAEIVREHVPDVAIEVTESVDPRNYRVDFDKLANVFGFHPTRTVSDGIAEIVRAVDNRHVADIRDAYHSNVRALIETDARHRLWREDLAGRPADAFRPRDVEVLQRVMPSRRHAMLEDAIT